MKNGTSIKKKCRKEEIALSYYTIAKFCLIKLYGPILSIAKLYIYSYS